uniref:Uncharacterized protein n=1 Tax=Manihot esculenta TaxID=3983 RepID=A0A199UBQ3_MANES
MKRIRQQSQSNKRRSLAYGSTTISYPRTQQENKHGISPSPAEFLVGKIVSIIENEASLLGRARDDLEQIK